MLGARIVKMMKGMCTSDQSLYRKYSDISPISVYLHASYR